MKVEDKELIVQCISNDGDLRLELMRVYIVKMTSDYYYLLTCGLIVLKSRFIIIEEDKNG